MRAFIIIFIIVLCISCFLNDSGAQPYKWPVGIGGTDLKGKTELSKREPMMPELKYVDSPRDVGIMTQIDDTPMTPDSVMGEYPYAANN
jgi:hypothetical protein